MKPSDLNADGTPKILVRGKYDLCGATGNCAFWIFAKRGKGYHKLLAASDYFEIRQLGDQIINHQTNGYRDISVKGHITASNTSYQTFQFNGRRYVESRCIAESCIMAFSKTHTVPYKAFKLR
jgi:hypothetical protein